MEIPANLCKSPIPMPDNLALPADQIREMGRAALDLVAAYYDTLAERPVLQPTTSGALRLLTDEPAPRDPTPFPNSSTPPVTSWSVQLP